jgi:hypothetical protein
MGNRAERGMGGEESGGRAGRRGKRRRKGGRKAKERAEICWRLEAYQRLLGAEGELFEIMEHEEDGTSLSLDGALALAAGARTTEQMEQVAQSIAERATHRHAAMRHA